MLKTSAEKSAPPDPALQIPAKVLLVRPSGFHCNPQTFETNTYQHTDDRSPAEINAAAISEYEGLKTLLETHEIDVQTFDGNPDAPDDVFPNWASVHHDGRLVLYPMMAQNRRIERRDDIIEWLKARYDPVVDLSSYELQGKCLEATASLWQDRVHRIVYASLSARTDKEMVEAWASEMNYTPHAFHTRNNAGKPVYHTDVMMSIGTTLSIVCGDAIVEEDRARVLGSLKEHREVLELGFDQLPHFCGNVLELRARSGKRYLVMSTTAYTAYTDAQKDVILGHVDEIIHTPLPTLEKYGGGSARCMMMDLL